MLGEKMKLIRNYNGYSQRQIAEILITVACIRRIVRSGRSQVIVVIPTLRMKPAEIGRIFLRFSALQKSSMSAWIIF